jgi:hypothetical protein
VYIQGGKEQELLKRKEFLEAKQAAMDKQLTDFRVFQESGRPQIDAELSKRETLWMAACDGLSENVISN